MPNPIVPPKTPTITSANLPKPPVEPRIAADELDDSIVARPLVAPDFINVKAKNPNVSFRWINRVAGEGLRYSQALAMGFVNATSSDCEMPACYQKDGAIINGDLILMKLDRKIYLGALKNKDQQALYLAEGRGQHREAARRAGAVLSEAGAGKAAQEGKIAVFTPSEAETARLGGS